MRRNSIYIKFFMLVVLLTTHCYSVHIVYERASIRDIGEILALYNAFSEDDCQKIIVFPKQIRRAKLREALRKGRIFIARDRDDHDHIVSFLKLFLVTDPEELLNILCNDIRCMRKKPKLVESGHYAVNYHKSFDFNTPLKLMRNQISYKFLQNQTYIYYGNAYTKTDYRGIGINTLLQECALEDIKREAIQHIIKTGSNKIFYLYGQVDANSLSTGSVRTFTEFAHDIKAAIETTESEVIRVNYFAFQTFKPSFIINDDGELEQLPDNDPLTQAGRGLGKMLSCNIKTEA